MISVGIMRFYFIIRSYPDVLDLIDKLSFDTSGINTLFRQYMPQLAYYREKSEEVKETLASQCTFSDVLGREGDQQVRGGGPLKRSAGDEKEVRDLRLQNCDATIEQITAYKVACEYLKRDNSWKYKWGITPTNANNGKKLITLGGMYPIVSGLIFSLFGSTQSFQICVHQFQRILRFFLSSGFSMVAAGYPSGG